MRVTFVLRKLVSWDHASLRGGVKRGISLSSALDNYIKTVFRHWRASKCVQHARSILTCSRWFFLSPPGPVRAARSLGRATSPPLLESGLLKELVLAFPTNVVCTYGDVSNVPVVETRRPVTRICFCETHACLNSSRRFAVIILELVHARDRTIETIYIYIVLYRRCAIKWKWKRNGQERMRCIRRFLWIPVIILQGRPFKKEKWRDTDSSHSIHFLSTISFSYLRQITEIVKRAHIDK